MTKTTNGKTVSFHPVVRTYQQPKVIESFMDDAGQENYILSNGNTTLADRYNALWNPTKTEIKHKNYKGINPDGTKSIYK